MKITFNGAAGMVTGSCHYIETEKARFLIDCGMFQGSVLETKYNHEDFTFNPSDLDFVILTHCHIDHSGRLPMLIKQGFKGKIFMTPPTKDLVEILLLDSAKIQLQDQEKSKEDEVDSSDLLYTEDDVYETIQYFYPLKYEQTFTEKDIRFIYHNAGHLIGSAYVEIDYNDKKIVFSGDLGHEFSLLQNPPAPLKKADYVFMESTYGNRIHEHIDLRLKSLYTEVFATIDNKGTIIIPAFSVGRTQEMLYSLKSYAIKHNRYEDFKKIPIYVDSPLAINATEIYLKNLDYLRADITKEYIKYDNVHIVNSMKESIGLNFNTTSKIIISAAGMCDAGRILNHLAAYLPNDKTKILFVGYQANESIGRKIQNKENPIQIGKESISNNAQIVKLDGFSGHGDLNDLKNWVNHLESPPSKTILVHGEVDSLENLKKELQTMNHNVHIAKLYETIELK
ncbi:MAG: MBL fold metallo-hydrolase [Clostridiales bacterium]|nr:MBL fold metallo-hydrolase [Clostridiales bacterium]